MGGVGEAQVKSRVFRALEWRREVGWNGWRNTGEIAGGQSSGVAEGVRQNGWRNTGEIASLLVMGGETQVKLRVFAYYLICDELSHYMESTHLFPWFYGYTLLLVINLVVLAILLPGVTPLQKKGKNINLFVYLLE